MHAIPLSCDNLTKCYGQFVALERLSLDIEQGKYVALVGANGAGKTTLIKCLLDFCEIDSGTIKLFGIPHHRTEARLSISYLPERFAPPYYLSGRDFLKYILSLRKMSYKEESVTEMLLNLDLDPSLLDKPVRTLSKGMTQKLGLSACFLSGQRFLLLDEPMSGLDPKARAMVKRHLLRLKEQGNTLLFSTHMLSDVAELCDRMVILHHGKLRFTGSPEECCQRYSAKNLEQAYLNCLELDHAPLEAH